jgi:hypothetical protein
MAFSHWCVRKRALLLLWTQSDVGMGKRMTHIAFFLCLVDNLGQFLIDDVGWWWEG